MPYKVDENGNVCITLGLPQAATLNSLLNIHYLRIEPKEKFVEKDGTKKKKKRKDESDNHHDMRDRKKLKKRKLSDDADKVPAMTHAKEKSPQHALINLDEHPKYSKIKLTSETQKLFWEGQSTKEKKQENAASLMESMCDDDENCVLPIKKEKPPEAEKVVKTEGGF